MKRINILASAVGIFCGSFVQGQTLTAKLPKDAMFIFGVNGKSIQSKMGDKPFKNQEFFKFIEEKITSTGEEEVGETEAVEETVSSFDLGIVEEEIQDRELKDSIIEMNNSFPISQLWINADKAGINIADEAYISYSKNDTGTFSLALLKLKNISNLESFIDTLSDELKNNIVRGDSYSFLPQEEYSIAWTKDYICFVTVDISYSFVKSQMDQDDIYYEDYSERRKAQEKKEEKLTQELNEKYVNRIYNLPKSESLAGHENYTEIVGGNWDAFYFLSNSFNSIEDELITNSMKPDEVQRIKETLAHLKGNHSYGHLLFEDSEVNIESFSYFNDHLLPMVKKIGKSKMNKKLLSYLKGSNLLGFYSMSINSEGVVELGREIILPMLKAIPFQGGLIAKSIDFAGAFVDEDRLYDFFKGNVIVALTGINEKEVSYVSYDYDENYNRTRVTKTKMQSIPEFAVLVESSDEKLMEKFLNVLGSIPYLSEENGYYKIQGLGRGGINMYLAYENDVFIFTNDESLVTTYLESGVPSSEKIAKKDKKLILKNRIAGYLNVKETLSKITEEDAPQMKKYFTEVSSTIDEMKWTGMENDGNTFSQSISISLKNKENAILQIMEMLNRMTRLDEE